MSVVAHDPLYPIETAPDLMPCCDGAGIVVEVGKGSHWAVGEKVLIRPTVWAEGVDPPTLEESGGLGPGSAQGMLREYAILI